MRKFVSYERERDENGRPSNARPRDRYGRPLPRGARNEMVSREEPEDVVSSIGEALQKAVALFNAERFFEAHEFFEYIWKHEEVPASDRDFWKGVTQVAVGCVHTQRGNAKGALTLLERSLGYLAPYPLRHHGIDRRALMEAAARVAAQVRRDGPSPDVTFPEFPLGGRTAQSS